MLIVMALLVNFSYPITMFVIDFSNSAMYYLIGSIADSTSATLAKFSGFATTIYDSAGVSDDLVDILLSIIFLFIFLCTLMAVGLNLLIRILAFSILIILSPAGFAFAFFPDTKSIANSWWSALFKYAFMGPVMVFFIYLANLIFNIGNQNGGDLVGSIVRYIIPIVFLWMGLIISSKFGGDGSKMAMGIAGKVGGNIKSYGQKAAWGGVKAVGRFADDRTENVISGGIGAAKMKLSQWNDDHKTASNTRATQFADRLGVTGANEKLVRDIRKRWKDEGVSPADLDRMGASGTAAEKMAVALERSENGRFSDNANDAFRQYQEGLAAIGTHPVYQNLFNKEIRKKNVDLEIRENVRVEEERLGRGLNEVETRGIARAAFTRVGQNDWKEQNIQRTVDYNTSLGHNGVRDAAVDVLGNYSSEARTKIVSEMGGKYAAGHSAGMWT